MTSNIGGIPTGAVRREFLYDSLLGSARAISWKIPRNFVLEARGGWQLLGKMANLDAFGRKGRVPGGAGCVEHGTIKKRRANGIRMVFGKNQDFLDFVFTKAAPVGRKSLCHE